MSVFYFGALHGCLLSPQTGQLRPDVTALVTCSHPDVAKGYYVGRHGCFMDTPSNQHIYTDGELLEELCQIAQDVIGYPDEENSWYYSIGCVLGNMSAQVFLPHQESTGNGKRSTASGKSGMSRRWPGDPRPNC
ncbi:MAG: hypothetical protein ACJ8BW_15880 [Ktedonobacteraceae bacterium]